MSQKIPETSQLGRFGTAAEFNHLGQGSLVNPQTQLGLRPTFRLIRDLFGGSQRFWASPYPGFSTIIQNGFDWLSTYPQVGSVVHTELISPVNILCSVPFLVSAPVSLIPLLPNTITPEQWRAAGLDPERQALDWRLPDGARISLSPSLNGVGFRYTEGGTGATIVHSLSPTSYPFTEGLALEQQQDFVRVNAAFSCLPLQDQFLPAGQYQFRIDLAVIPRALAYQPSDQIPLIDCYRNVHLPPLSNYPTTSLLVIGEMPANFPLPAIMSMSAQQGRPGDSIEFTGSLLERTQAVVFAPDIPSDFSVLSDQQVRATVPALATSGEIVLQTARGYVASPVPFAIEGIAGTLGPHVA